MNDRPIPESGYNARRGCVLIGTGLFAILVLWAAVMTHLFVVANRPPNIRIPTHSVPSPNAYDDWEAAGKLMRGIKPIGPLSDTRPIESWTLPELKAFVDANQPVFDLFRQGLAKPYKHPPLRSFSDFGANPVFREIARRVTGEALYHKAAGHPGRAAQCCLDVVEMGVRIPDGGVFVTALVGMAIEAIGCSELPGLLPELSHKDLLAVQTRIEWIQAQRVPASEIILEEGRCSVSSWQEVLSEEWSTRDVASLAGVSFDSDFRPGALWAAVTFAFQNKQAMLEELQSYYEQLAREAEGPFYKGPPRTVPPRSLPGEMDGGIAGSIPVAGSRSPAILELLRTDCALRRYRMDHGRYPDSLAQLVPRYMNSVPLDPCGGQPLKYRPLKGGRDFLLYSIGPNLKDDGGLAGKYRDPAAKSDIVEGRWHE